MFQNRLDQKSASQMNNLDEEPKNNAIDHITLKKKSLKLLILMDIQVMNSFFLNKYPIYYSDDSVICVVFNRINGKVLQF